MVRLHHPDRANTKDPSQDKLFLQIRDAYEEILKLKGLKKQKSFLNEQGEEIKKYQRKDFGQYSEDFSKEEQIWKGRDKEEFFRTI
jgi:hypothetical protein